MTDHSWTQDNLAAFLADGLDAGERDRFQAHVRDCGECATALEAARAFDAGLANLFAAVRPGPTLEDRTVPAFGITGLVSPTAATTAPVASVTADANLLSVGGPQAVTLNSTLNGLLGAGANLNLSPGDFTNLLGGDLNLGSGDSPDLKALEAELKRLSKAVRKVFQGVLKG